MTTSKQLATALKALHKPSSPLILPNIWDYASLKAVLSLNGSDTVSGPVKAIATASWAVAESQGIKDEDLTFEQNMAAIGRLAPHVQASGLPLTVDIQDGYGARIEEAIPERGFGGGIEESLYGVEEQVDRLKAALAAPAAAGCEGFVLNARCDVFRLEPYCEANDKAFLEEGIKRGRAYLEAGATTVFFWGGGGRGLRTSEVEVLVKELGGRVSVKLGEKDDSLTTRQLGEMGVARISVGPSLYSIAMRAVAEAARNILSGGGFKG
ncbi:conserved hypothetical protein [Verticillium alfalfae VaMs.102]|uniref:PEP phosphonomutase n=1 Tax=Verticillium alfalfae (strain VaMs.102 / ATCC MYA-4576 / FGSC 10136) TaxID=526221 RepID=C9SRU6_VERA1|nr:conserved hypothetical protein [Verticillium alfalfae VaMs.102]EEY21511.1 conserved hypothetical protein [Verticillium alfalfae VaMs.102]